MYRWNPIRVNVTIFTPLTVIFSFFTWRDVTWLQWFPKLIRANRIKPNNVLFTILCDVPVWSQRRLSVGRRCNSDGGRERGEKKWKQKHRMWVENYFYMYVISTVTHPPTYPYPFYKLALPLSLSPTPLHNSYSPVASLPQPLTSSLIYFTLCCLWEEFIIRLVQLASARSTKDWITLSVPLFYREILFSKSVFIWSENYR